MGEKALHEVPRPLREQFDRGMAAYQKSNLDYAVALFTEVLRKEPAFYECREALRAAQFRRVSGGSKLLRKLFAQASPLLAKGQLELRTRPADALHTAEQMLNDEPRSVPAHKLLAEAAMVLGLARTAVLSLEILFKNAPADREIALKLAAALVAAGQVERADRIYADLLRANPSDPEVAKAYKDLGARRTLEEKGYAQIETGAASYRDILKDENEAVTLEQENRQQKSGEITDRLIADYEGRLRVEPGNPKVLRNLADLLAQKKEFDRALEIYRRVIDVEGKHDPSLEKLIAETTVRRYDHQISELDPHAPDYAAQRTRLERERDAFELDECRGRSERHPNDLQIRYELGALYLKAGRIGEAIQELQRAQNHPHRRLQAMALLAQCFAHRGMFDLAARTLQNAIREKPILDEEKKDLIYHLGCVLERMGKADDAVEQFKLIYENDIRYRDVAARVDAYYASKTAAQF
jgi:tetratricopeptide (TPR) repeat protein